MQRAGLDSPKDTLRMGSEFSGAQGRAVVPVTVDYFAVLSRAIEASRTNPGQLRDAIYNMARVNLRREIVWQNPAISEAELDTHLLALEDAIQRVEATHSGTYDNLVFRPDDPRHLIEALNLEPSAEAPPATDVQIEQTQEQVQEQVWAMPEPQAEPATAFEPDPAPVVDVEPYVEPERPRAIDLDAQFEPVNEHEPPADSRCEIVILEPELPMAMQSGPMLRAAPNIIVDYHPPSHDIAYAPEPPPRRVIRNSIGSFVQLTAAALLAVAIFAVMTGQLDIRWLAKKPQQAAVQPPAPDVVVPKVAASAAVSKETAPPLPFPLPATYGVYAVSNDKLVELDKFSIRVPDPRVLISPEIREPSRVTLTDGNVSFVVFRRELANGAPEKVVVRVVAKIAREMTFTDGKAATNNVENLWRIRNNAFDFKVSPLGDNRDLIAIKADAGFVFPPGRYALVIGGQGYDFSVAGPITSPQQCLERIETVNGAMYSECRNSQVN
jgi:hypothetical protein